jgi:uncharacterized protein involved in exopolysaccharide biosynthesis
MDTGKSAKTSLRDFLHIIFKRKWQIVFFFGACVFTVTIGSFMATPTYEATVQLLVKVGRENIYVPTLPASGTPNPIISGNREEQLNSEIEILKSRSLAESVVDALGPTVVYEDLGGTGQALLSGFFKAITVRQPPGRQAALRLQKALGVKRVRGSDVIEVSFRHKDPSMAATVANALVELYFDRHLAIHTNPQAYDFFREQAQTLKDKLRQAEENMETFKKQQAVTSLTEERTLLLAKAADLRAALNETLGQEAETDKRISKLRQQLATTTKTIPLDEEISEDPGTLGSLQVKLVELQLKEHELRSKYTDHSRFVQSVKEEIEMVRKKLVEQEGRRYRSRRAGVNTVYQALEQELLRNESNLKALAAKKESQNARLEDYRNRLDDLNGIEKEFNRLQQEVEVDRQNYRLYLSKFEESRISNAMDMEKISNVSLIDPARPPDKPISPKIFLNMVLGIILGGSGAFGLALISEYLNDTFEREEDVESHLRLPVLASIPELRR